MFRKTILAELERQGLSRYALAENVADRISRSAVYEYLAGKKDMGSEKVSILCKELGLTLKRSTGRK